MTMPPPLQDRQPPGQYPQKRMSSGSKVLIGCGIGCGVIIGIILIIAGFAGWWVFSTEDQVPTDKILNTGSSAAFRLEDISENQALMKLVSDVLKESQRINRKRSPVQLPESLKKVQNYFEGQQDPARFIEIFTPREATLSVSSDVAGNPVFTVAANFGTGTRIAKMLLNGVFESNEQLKGEKISTEHGDLFLFDDGNGWSNDKSHQGIVGFYKGTFIFSNDQKAAISALDRLAEGNSTGRLNETLADPFYRQSRKGVLVYGVLDGSLLKKLNYGKVPFKGELASEIKKVEISLDQVSGDKGTLNLSTDWNNKEFAEKVNEEVEKLKPEWINKARQNGFDMEVMNSLKDDQLDIQFQVNNLKDSLIYQIQNAD